MCANMDAATSNALPKRPEPDGYVCDDPLLNAREAAAETGRALSTFWRDVRTGLLPQPYRVLPRMPRWRRSELRAAINACRATETARRA